MWKLETSKIIKKIQSKLFLLQISTSGFGTDDENHAVRGFLSSILSVTTKIYKYEFLEEN